MRMLQIHGLALAGLIALLTSTGCATIMNGDMVHVPVTSNPNDAKVFVAGREYRTPTTVDVPRGKGDYKLTVEKAGYKPYYVMLQQSLDAWLWGNAIFGGLIGVGVDFLSGDAHDVEPEAVDCELTKEEKSIATAPMDARREHAPSISTGS